MPNILSWNALVNYIVVDDVYALNKRRPIYKTLDALQHLPRECFASVDTLVNAKCNMEKPLYRKHVSPIISCSDTEGVAAFVRGTHCFDPDYHVQLTRINAKTAIHVPTALEVMEEMGLGDTVLDLTSFRQLPGRSFNHYLNPIRKRISKENEYICLEWCESEHVIINDDAELDDAIGRLVAQKQQLKLI